MNSQALKQLEPEHVNVEIRMVEPPEAGDGSESELDEIWSYVGKTENPRWLHP